jgi:hypothetical protein
MKELLESLQLIDSKINDCQYELTRTELDKDRIFDLLKDAGKETKALLNKMN